MKKLLVFLLLIPASASGQARTAISAYVASDAAVPDHPLLVGGTLARERGPLALRFGMGFDVSAPAEAVTPSALAPTSGVGTMDLDALLYLGNPGGSAAIIPFALVGAGMRGLRSDGSFGVAANYSYGGGFRAPLGGGFSVEGEARHREFFAETLSGPEPVAASGMEFRVGLNVGFGGPSANPRPIGVPPVRGPAGTRVVGAVVSADTRMRLASAALNTAERYIGVRYQWGGNTPRTGFDCSGFIRYVYAQHGISVPRVSVDQARFGTPVPLQISAFEPGDILAFASDGRVVDHTAIYAGNGRIIHSSSSGNGVRYDDLGSQRGRWYLEHLVAARRVIDAGYYAALNTAR